MGLAVIGIDPDSKHMSLVITIDGKNPVLRQRLLPVNVPIARTLDVIWTWVYRIVRDLVKEGHEVHVAVEAPFVSPKTIRAAIPLSRINGVLLAAPQRAGATSVLPVIIQHWKQDVVGRGNASKPQIAAWCKRDWPEVFEEAAGRQDLIDASGINLHMQRLVARSKRVEKWHEEHDDDTPKKTLKKRKN